MPGGNLRPAGAEALRPAGNPPRPGAAGDPSGHQAGKYHPPAGRRGGSHRLRHCPAVQGRSGYGHPPHGHPLHRRPGAVRLRSDRPAHRSVRPGDDADLAGHRHLRAGGAGPGNGSVPVFSADPGKGRILCPGGPVSERVGIFRGPGGEGPAAAPASMAGPGGVFAAGGPGRRVLAGKRRTGIRRGRRGPSGSGIAAGGGIHILLPGERRPRRAGPAGGTHYA